jgi:hypothetical protein
MWKKAANNEAPVLMFLHGLFHDVRTEQVERVSIFCPQQKAEISVEFAYRFKIRRQFLW